MVSDRTTQAALRKRLIDVLQSFLEGRVPRSAITTFTREVWPHSKRGGPCFGDGIASTVFDSLWNVEEPYAGDYLLRESDLETYVGWLTEGDPLSNARTIAWIRRSATELAAHPNARDTRFWMDGLGWYLSVDLTSPKTGRLFIATGSMDFESKLRVAGVHTTGEADPDVIQDLLDTFAIGRHEIEMED